MKDIYLPMKAVNFPMKGPVLSYKDSVLFYVDSVPFYKDSVPSSPFFLMWVIKQLYYRGRRHFVVQFIICTVLYSNVFY